MDIDISLTMVTVIAPALLSLLATGLYHRLQAARSRDILDRRNEGLPLLFGIRICAFIGLCFTIQALIHRPHPTPLRLTGAALTYLSAAWLIWMFRTLGRNITDTVQTRKNARFVDWGPYRYVRNPMYTGLLALGASLGLALSSWPVALAFAAVFTLLALRTAKEETFLIARFGDRYRDYMRRTGRFWPAF